MVLACGSETSSTVSDASSVTTKTDAASDGTDATDTADGADATDEADGADATDAADGAEATDAADGADATDAADGADAADAADGADATDAADGADATDVAECDPTSSCKDVMYGDRAPESLCPDTVAKQSYDSLETCVCTDVCKETCGPTICLDLPSTDECDNCLTGPCDYFFDECYSN